MIEDFVCLLLRRPPDRPLSSSSAASGVYTRQAAWRESEGRRAGRAAHWHGSERRGGAVAKVRAVSYTHFRVHETALDLVCRLLLVKKNF